jgi:hypothetical protein
MQAHAREIRRWAVGLAMTLALGACTPPPPELQTVETRPLPSDAASTLHIDREGRLWLGEPGAFLVIDGDGGTWRFQLPTAQAPRVLAERAGRMFALSADSTLMVLSDPADSVPAAAVRGLPFVEPRDRWIFVGGGSGAVLIHEPAQLRLISAWGALGAPTTAITGSPEGDRIYQALDEEGAGTILTRDLQTGRVLRTSSFSAPLLDLIADREGNLIGIIGEARDAAIISLRPWGDELELRWRERIPAASHASRLRLSPAGERVAVITPGEHANGLRVLDTETGANLGHLPDSPLDAAFDAAGRLILLYPGELRVVR